MDKKKSFHYAWLIVFSCFMIMSLYFCIVMNCPGLFLISVTEAFDITRSQYALNTTVISVSMMVVALSAGKIFAKFKIKTVMSIASVILPIAYACYSLAQNVYMFYGISLIVGLCLGLCGMVPMSTLITRWFNDKKGLATGLAFTGSGVGGMILQPIIGKLIVSAGWRKTYLILGVAMFVLVVPCVLFLIKDYPEDKGLKPYGDRPKTQQGEDAPAEGLMLSQAKTTMHFWVFLPIVTLTSAAACSMVQQIAPYVTDLGYRPTVAANIGALSLGTLAVGKILLGQIYDIKGTVFGTVLGFVCLIGALACYTGAFTAVLLYIGIVISGIGIAYTTVGYPINTQTMFGKKDYSSIYGIVSCFSSIGTAIGSPITSMIFDRTGSYRTAWIMWAVISTVSLAIFLFLSRTAVKVKEK